MESVERWQSSLITKIFLIRIFYKMEQKNWHHNLGFWAPAFTYNQNIPMNFQKNSWLREKMESVERRQSSVIIKISLIRSFYIMEQKINPHLGFWARAFTYIQIIPMKFQKL